MSTGRISAKREGVVAESTLAGNSSEVSVLEPSGEKRIWYGGRWFENSCNGRGEVCVKPGVRGRPRKECRAKALN